MSFFSLIVFLTNSFSEVLKIVDLDILLNLELIAENENLRFSLVQIQVKLLVYVQYLNEHMKESSIENIINVGNLIRDNFIDIEILSGSDNFAKIEKFTDECIIKIVNQALADLMRPVSQNEYFKIRGDMVT